MTEYVFTLSDKTPSVEIDVKETAIAHGAGQDLYDRAKKELGFTGTFEEFLASFKGERGEKGEDGAAGAKGDTGERGIPGERGLDGLPGMKGDKGDTGERGQDGKSAYEIAVANGYTGDEEQWLASLKGRDGERGRDGRNGLSAYDLADGELLYGTVDKWLESLKGATGAAGKSASVTIGTVTTGETASVTNTGTESEAVLNFVLPAGGGGQPNGLHTEIKTVPVTVNSQQIQTVEFEAKFAETPTLHGQPALMGAGENRFLYLLSVDKNGFTCRSNYFIAGVQAIHYAVTGKLA